jgi:carbon-monoxide dehydrogenase large subunit
MATSGTGRAGGIGDSMLRLEDERLLTGKAQFVDDIEPGQDTLHVAFVRSPRAHARINSISIENALAVAGVVHVFTARDLGTRIKAVTPDTPQAGFQVVSRDVFCTDKVRFVGDLVAMVLAEDPYAALDGAELVDIDFEDLPPITSVVQATRDDAILLHEGTSSNVAFEMTFASPDFAARDADTPHRLKHRFKSARMAAAPMEPRGCIGRYDAAMGQLEFWTSTQVPHLVQGAICEHLGLQESDVRVIAPDVGGGFGMKTVIYPEELAVAAATLASGRPVKWIQDRYDDLLTSAQAREYDFTIEMSFDDRGKLIAVHADVMVDIGAYPSLPFGASFEANSCPRNLPNGYQIKNFAYRTRAIFTNKAPTGAYRGVTLPVMMMGVESMLDLIAGHLGIDPVEVRRINVIRTFPYENVMGLTYAEGCWAEAFERALVLADYDAVRARQRGIDPDDEWQLGIGMAICTEQTGMGAARYKARGLFRIPGFETANIKVEPDGSVSAAVSINGIGQSSRTAFTQIVADELRIDPRRIRMILGDTGRTGRGSGAFASRGIVIAGNAIMQACGQIKDKLKTIAAAEFQVTADMVEIADNGDCVWGEHRLSVAELAAKAYNRALSRPSAAWTYGIEATAYGDTPSITLASTVHIAIVKVNIRTGEVGVVDYVIMHDTGRMVNPMLVDGQIIGGTLQGLGEVLMEAIEHDENGQPMSINFMAYEIPHAGDAIHPKLEAMHTAEGGAMFKGAGEAGTIAAVPALICAIRDALKVLHVPIFEKPLPASRLLSLIIAAQEARDRS